MPCSTVWNWNPALCGTVHDQNCIALINQPNFSAILCDLKEQSRKIGNNVNRYFRVLIVGPHIFFPEFQQAEFEHCCHWQRKVKYQI
jgi:hypothetical protein